MIDRIPSDILLPVQQWMTTTFRSRLAIPPTVRFMTLPLLILGQAGVGEAADRLGQGTSIAIAGLMIVFTALVLISLFIASLPRILAMVAKVWPEVDDPHSHPGHHESSVPDDAAVLAAIGFVLHTEMQKQLAAEKASSQNR